MSKHADIEYWAKKLKENSTEINRLTKKLYDNHLTLETEELYELRSLLSRNAALVDLLNTTVSLPEPQPRWKTFFRK
jgi:hypothetical protein